MPCEGARPRSLAVHGRHSCVRCAPRAQCASNGSPCAAARRVRSSRCTTAQVRSSAAEQSGQQGQQHAASRSPPCKPCRAVNGSQSAARQASCQSLVARSTTSKLQLASSRSQPRALSRASAAACSVQVSSGSRCAAARHAQQQQQRPVAASSRCYIHPLDSGVVSREKAKRAVSRSRSEEQH